MSFLNVFLLWLVLFTVGAVLLWRFEGPRRVAAARVAFANLVEERRERLRSPNWEFYEAHLGRPVPDALRRFYAQTDLLLSDGLNYEPPIPGAESCCSSLTFLPVDPEELVAGEDWNEYDFVPFAHDEEGDPIFLRPGADVSNAVYIFHHDGGEEPEELADSIETFFARLRIDDH